MDLATQLKRDESVKLQAYDDATGKTVAPGTLVKGNVTAGVGRNLYGKGLSTDEVNYLLANDISEVKIELARALPWTTTLDDARRGVLLNMAFNMGVPGLLKFKQTLAYVQAGNWTAASQEMLRSAWSTQVGQRAQRLSTQLLTGVWT